MADGSFTNTLEAIFTAVVKEAMAERMRFGALRYKIAALGKQHGVFVTGTERCDGTIVVTYDGGKSVEIPETESYRLAVRLSTW